MKMVVFSRLAYYLAILGIFFGTDFYNLKMIENVRKSLFFEKILYFFAHFGPNMAHNLTRSTNNCLLIIILSFLPN